MLVERPSEEVVVGGWKELPGERNVGVMAFSETVGKDVDLHQVAVIPERNEMNENV